jgi:hypothetical protein
MDHDPERMLHLHVILDGREHAVNVRPSTLVIDVIREALGASRADQADRYELVRRTGQVLDPGTPIGSTGVEDHEVLSLNKHDGGGGLR